MTSFIIAHPGKTDENGGHTCYTNCEQYGLKHGQYHYHNGSSGTSYTVYPSVTNDEESSVGGYIIVGLIAAFIIIGIYGHFVDKRKS